MAVKVKHYLTHQIVTDPTSPLVYHLRQAGDTTQVHDIKSVADEIEELGALSADDVRHSMFAFVRQLKKILLRGDRVKVDELGTFYLTFRSEGKATEEESTVKTINHLKVRFLEDKELRLANDSTTATRSKNNVEFVLAASEKSVTELTITGVTLNGSPVPAKGGTLTCVAGNTLKIQGAALSQTAIEANFATSPAGSSTDRSLSDIGTISATPTLITINVTITKALISKLLRVDNRATLYAFEEEE